MTPPGGRADEWTDDELDHRIQNSKLRITKAHAACEAAFKELAHRKWLLSIRRDFADYQLPDSAEEPNDQNLDEPDELE